MTRLRARLAELKAEQQYLQRKIAMLAAHRPNRLAQHDTQVCTAKATVTIDSSSQRKVQFFRQLFAGRQDVFPSRWENKNTARAGYSPACSNEWKSGVCRKPKVKCGQCPHQEFIPPDDKRIEGHLRGDRSAGKDSVVGVYPLLTDDTCRFLAADFDKVTWAEDAQALLQTCHKKGVPAALERSRSGNGGPVWIFISEPVAASLARQLGSALITETMAMRAEIDFAAYDRLFPNQDTIPVGGFSNLIALPLQNAARRQDNSVFVDAELRPYCHEWAYLSSLPRLSRMAVTNLVVAVERSGNILWVKMPVVDENSEEPWKQRPSRRSRCQRLDVPVPTTVSVTFADQVYVD